MPERLQPRLIEQVNGVLDGPMIPHSPARWARDASGRQWVRKPRPKGRRSALIAEAASYLLGEALEVRQPQGAVFHDGRRWSWMSQRIDAAGEHWHPDMRDLLANVDEVGRMLTLDALVINPRRHARSLLAEPVGNDAHLRLWALPPAEALIGYPSAFIAHGLTSPADYSAPNLPIGALRASALAAAQVAAQLPDERLQDIVREACTLGSDRPSGPRRLGPLSRALIARCRHAPQIVSAALGVLP